MRLQSRAAVLAEPLQPARDQPAPAALAAQRRAWFCLCAAFVVWAALVGVGLYAANTWRKTAYTTPAAQLVSKRGIVLYQGPHDRLPVSISETAALEEGGVIDVPPSSEATIQLGVDNSLVRIRSGAQIKLTSMRVGRFSRDLTQVGLEQIQGAANYSIAGELPGGREVEIKTPNTPGALDSIKLTKGEYLVWVQPTGTRLQSYGGQARAEVAGSVARLRDGHWVDLGTTGTETPRSQPLPEQLVRNRDFTRSLGTFWTLVSKGEPGKPDVGGQATIVDDEIEARGVRGVHFTRETTKDTHNDTFLTQDIDREVWAFRSATLSAWVRVNSASLDGGGSKGSEYPLMLRMDYIAENGGKYTWQHGFYVQNSSEQPVDYGEQIRPGEWYRYTLDLNQLKDRPAYVGTIQVLASGHDFDSQVASVELAVE